MKRFLPVLLASALLAMGCGKKSDPQEVTSGAVQTTIHQLSLQRTDTTETTENARLSATLQVQNGHSGTIHVTRIEFTGYAGGHPAPFQRVDMEMDIKEGQTGKIEISTPFELKNEADFNAEKGRFEGTVYYKGPKGHPQADKFDLQGDLEIRGQ